MSPTIPKSGNLGRIAKNLEEEYGKDFVEKIFHDFKSSLSGVKKANWILKMVKKIEEDLGEAVTIEIIEKSGRQSCSIHFKNTVKKLIKESDSTKEFVEKLNKQYRRSSFFELYDEHTIIGGHRKCYDAIKSAPKPIDSLTYCHCCLGHGKEFYETALDTEVDGEIVETVMAGGLTCKFKFNF